MGGFPIWTCPSFFVRFCPFLGLSQCFPGFSRLVRGFSRFVLSLFLGLSTAPTRSSLERVRDTIRAFPEKSGKPPGLASLKLEKAKQEIIKPRIRRTGQGSSLNLETGMRWRGLPHRSTDHIGKKCQKCQVFSQGLWTIIGDFFDILSEIPFQNSLKFWGVSKYLPVLLSTLSCLAFPFLFCDFSVRIDLKQAPWSRLLKSLLQTSGCTTHHE